VKVEPCCERPFSASSALQDLDITDIPAILRLDLAGNGSLSLAADFHHGLLARLGLVTGSVLANGLAVDRYSRCRSSIQCVCKSVRGPQTNQIGS